MARTVEQIEQDIVALEQAIATFAQEFEQAYQQYLEALSQSARRQLILACYYLCTQSYPEQFLKQSVGQRESLQRSLRQVAKTAQSKLLAYLNPSDAAATEPSDVPSDVPPSDTAKPSVATLDGSPSIADLDLANTILSEFGALENDPEENDPEENDPEENDSEENDLESIDSEEDQLETSNASLKQWLSAHIPAVASTPGSNLNQSTELEKLARWQAQIERGISETLRDLSQAANHVLYQATILPNQLPEPLLELATKSGMAAESFSGQPNILKLMIEAKSESDVSVVEVTVVRLQLLDIEEADYELRVWPPKVRVINLRLNQLGREYQRKCRERAIAQSEQAWRAIWFED